jgi:hypothetical protein
MVAERERGLLGETLAAAPARQLAGREHATAYLISGVPGLLSLRLACHSLADHGHKETMSA